MNSGKTLFAQLMAYLPWTTVKTQIWIAVSVYVLVAIVKKQLQLEASLYTLLQILSVTLFEKIPLNQALAVTENIKEAPLQPNQLDLFTLLTGH
jgi:uncharacterized membrane protein